MDNNKKKTLIKSVAAFTFAMSMFAAQSPTASAAEIAETATAAGTQMSRQAEDGGDEFSDVEEAGDDKGDIVTSQDVIPETGAELVNSNGMAIGETYYDSSFYDKDAELGIANNFHIFTNGTVENNAHVNGNIAANKLGSDKNFGTDDLYEADIVYIENVDTKINRTNTDMTIVLGSDVAIEEYNNENGYMVVDSEGNEIYSENNKDNIFIEQEGTKYIDLDAEMKVYDNLSDVLAEYTETETDTDFSDMNNSYIVINEDGLSVVNMKASDFANIALFNIRNLVGCDDDSDQTLLINVDGEGTDVVINSQVKVYYEDGTERKNDEVTNFTDSRILWNFINTSNIAINNVFSGCVLAPDADVTFGANFDGNVIAQNVTIGGESHRWDFHGDLQLEEIDDSDIPTGSDPFEDPDSDPKTDPETGSEGGSTPEGGSNTTGGDNTGDEPTGDNILDLVDPIDPVVPNTPNVDAPVTPSTPDTTIPTTPDVAPSTPDTTIPTTPDVDVPATPIVPETPSTPSTPVIPSVPTAPSVPSAPTAPTAPTAPSVPNTSTPNATIPSAPVVNDTVSDADTVAPAPTVPAENNTSVDANNTDNLVDFDDSDVPLGNDPLESFEDGDVPLGDDPLLVDGATDNPTTGNSMALPRGAAAAAIASFLTMLYANKKNREEAAE